MERFDWEIKSFIFLIPDLNDLAFLKSLKISMH